MSYSILPPTLTALSGALATPADTELASAWPAVDRQTRNWLYDFLTTYFDPTTNTIKPAAIGGGTIPNGSVSGTNPQSGSQQQIVQGSIQAADIASGTITAAKIANAAITQQQMAANSIGTDQLKDGSVTSSKISSGFINGSSITPGTLTSALFAPGAVTSAAIAAAAVQNQHIATRAVDGSMLPQCSPGQILVGGGLVNSQGNSLTPQTLSGAITVDANGVTTLQSTLISSVLSFAYVVELGNPAQGCGKANSATAFSGGNTSSTGYNATGTPWNGRGLGQGAGAEANVAWVDVIDPANLLTVNDTVITTTQSVGGTNYNTYQKPIYVNQKSILLITLSIPGHNCGSHRLRMVTMADPTQPQNLQQYWGTTEVSSGASGSGVTSNDTMTRSYLTCLVSFAAPAGSALPYFYVDWYCQTGGANAMGLASSLGGSEYYGTISVVRLQ